MGRALVDTNRTEVRLANLERKLAELTNRQPTTLAFVDTAGTVRVRLGLHSDGKYGLRVWNAAGVLTVDSTA